MRHICLLLVAGFLLIAFPAHAETKPVPINTLVEQAKAYDGQTVTIAGEVIGDVMLRGEYGWINLTDGTNDIGVWAPAEALRAIKYAGRYHQKGDQVTVTGQFRRADPEHGGDLLVRAGAMTVLAAGKPVAHPVKSGRPLVAALSLVLAASLGLWRWRAHQRSVAK